MEEYIVKDGKKLRLGYTTGSCAAAAAKAAAYMLLTGRPKDTIDLLTPKGIRLHLTVEEIKITSSEVSCAIRKTAETTRTRPEARSSLPASGKWMHPGF